MPPGFKVENLRRAFLLSSFLLQRSPYESHLAETEPASSVNQQLNSRFRCLTIFLLSRTETSHKLQRTLSRNPNGGFQQRFEAISSKNRQRSNSRADQDNPVRPTPGPVKLPPYDGL
jgi:hypothetical protein